MSLCVFAIFRNESHIFDEWIRHYIDEGVDHFYLIDNGSTDDYVPVLEPYTDRITLFVDATPSSQVKLYNKYVLPELMNSEWDWVIGCDLDEFIWASSSSSKTLKDVLSEDVPEDVGLIKVPWEQHGSNGYVKQPKLVVPAFTRRRYCNHMIELKCIARCKAVKRLDIHYFEIHDGYRIVDSTFQKDIENTLFGMITEDTIKNAKIRCTHYQVQSLEWFENVKMTRGDAVFTQNTRDESYFKERDYNDVFDDSLYTKKNKPSNCFWLLMLVFFFSLLFIFHKF